MPRKSWKNEKFDGYEKAILHIVENEKVSKHFPYYAPYLLYI